MASGLAVGFSDTNHALFTYTQQPGPPAETIAYERDFYLAELLDLLQAIRRAFAVRLFPFC